MNSPQPDVQGFAREMVRNAPGVKKVVSAGTGIYGMGEATCLVLFLENPPWLESRSHRQARIGEYQRQLLELEKEYYINIGDKNGEYKIFPVYPDEWRYIVPDSNTTENGKIKILSRLKARELQVLAEKPSAFRRTVELIGGQFKRKES